MTRYEALLACREKAGSDSQLARDLGLTQPRVWRWINQSKQMPAEYVLTAERLYGISRHLLRPDIYPIEPVEAHQSRWAGVDQCAGIRSNGVDGCAGRVSGENRRILNGAQL